MSPDSYRSYLQSQGHPAAEIEKRLAVVEGFLHSFPSGGTDGELDAAGKPEVARFASKLIAERENTLENIRVLGDFALWWGRRQLYVAWVELEDCHGALEVLARRIEERHGRAVRERIFCDPLPPLGAPEKERWARTQAILARMAQELSPEESRAAWFQVQHGIPPEAWQPGEQADRELFSRCASIDEFLEHKRRQRNEKLTRLHAAGALWYTMPLDDEVLAAILSNPEIGVGRREGERIYFSKVPYNFPRYLHESDPVLKRYYACHCPLVREAILLGEPVSDDVCACSLGYASHSLAGLGLDLRGEVLESAVRGDPRCRFVFYQPPA